MTTPDFTTRSEFEAKTYELFHTAAQTREWNQGELLVAQVFRAQHASALTVERIERIAAAFHGFEDGSLDLQPALTALARAKVLRSRMDRGTRLYEVNY